MLKLYHIDAFASRVFEGNSACVVLLDRVLEDRLLLKIADENAVAETAFILPVDGDLILRWFTPDLEMDLCGHATLAAAFVIFNYYKEYIINNKVCFDTCEGDIIVERESLEDEGYIYSLDFPMRKGAKAQLPKIISDSLSIQPQEVYLSRDYHLVYSSAEQISNLVINREEFDKINLGQGGVVVSAPGYDKYDFVSRFFTPQASILEDPVTGSAHCTLAPYWGKRLKKEILNARQISKRGGDLVCKLKNDRVIISGSAVCYLKGEISI